MINMDDIKRYLINYNGEVKEYLLETKYDTKKSFYGKAVVKEINNIKLLYSYNTLVCAIYDNARCIKYFFNYDVSEKLLFSNTTLRHIKEFLLQNINMLALSNMIDGKITKSDIIKHESAEL